MINYRLSNHDRQNPDGPHFLAKPPKVQLEILCGRANFKMRSVDIPVYLIGTALDCDLVLGDRNFPEAHSYLIMGSEGLSLRYLGVGPEVLVNGQRIEAVELCDGDSIEMGDYEFIIHLHTSQQHPHGGKPLQQESYEFEPGELSETDELDIVQHLLHDIRDAVFPQHCGLRLYMEPEPPVQILAGPAADASASNHPCFINSSIHTKEA